MQKSQYYEMNLPDGPDYYNVEDFNQNTRTIDEELHSLSEKCNTTLLTATLSAGSTQVVFRNGAISADSMMDVYTNLPGLNYTEISVSEDETSVTLTFEAQSVDVVVRLAIH